MSLDHLFPTYKTRGGIANARAGQKWGLWEILPTPIKRNRFGANYYYCRCECGTEKYVRWETLYSGLSQSCGCTSSRKPRSNKAAKIN